MRTFWWWFRLALLTCVFLGLGAFLFTRTPWRRWIGFQIDFTPQITEGDRLVTAILQFRTDHALWPQYLDDVPSASAPNQFPWFYDLSTLTDPDGKSFIRPSLSTRAPTLGPRSHLGFDFDPEHPAWKLFGDIDPATLRPGFPAAYHPPQPLPPPEARRRALEELDRRIDREPSDVEHWRAKASILVAGDDLKAARACIDEAAQELPASYWPRMAKAFLDLRDNPAALPPSVTAFADWVQQKPTLTHWYYLAVLYRFANRPTAAADAMKQAVQCEVTVSPDDPNVAAFYLFDMARWSLAANRPDLTAALCDAWAAALEDGTLSDQSFIPFRAAAQLAEGETLAAAETLAKLPPTARHWAKNVDQLQAAITKGNRTFHYDPGANPPEFNVFPLPE